jgi:hypothetical protein
MIAVDGFAMLKKKSTFNGIIMRLIYQKLDRAHLLGGSGHGSVFSEHEDGHSVLLQH